jgi:gliding motility-associated-like protein
MITRFRNIGLLILLLFAGRMAAQVPVLDSLCSDATRYYRVDGEPGSTFSWILTPPSGVAEILPSNADTLAITWNYAPGIYGLQAIQHPLVGCDANAVTGQVIIFGQPDVFAGPDGQICIDGFYHLILATADYTRSVLWATSGDGTFDSNTLLDATYTPGPNDIIAGSVTLTITGYGLGDQGTCDPAVSTMLITITDQVIPEFIPAGPLCQYSEPPVLPSVSINGINGTWDPPAIDTDIPGTFMFTFTPAEGECAIPLQIRVMVDSLPVVYAGADQTIPIYGNTTIGDASASGSGTLTYSWIPAGLLVDPNVLNPTTLSLDATTVFTLTVKDSVGCQSIDSVTIFVSGGPLAVDPLAVPYSICLGESSNLFANASGGSGSYDYSWTSVPAGFNSNQANPVVSPVITTTYTVVVNDGYTIVSGEVTVVVNPLPEVYAGSDQTIPYGTSTTIGDATASGAEPLSYNWIPGGLLVDPTVLNPTTVNLLATTTFTLTVHDANGCSRNDEMTVYISSGPLAVTPAADPDTICAGGIAQLSANASGGTGIYSYQWTSVPPGFNSTEANPVVSPAATTIYTVEVSDGFNIVSGSVLVTVNLPPVVYAGTNQTIPYGTSTTIFDATASGTEPLTYSWSPASLLLDPAVLNPTTINLDVTTIFILTVTDSNGCESSDSVTIFIGGGPLTVDPSADPGEICQGGTVQLYANASGGSGAYAYNWTSDPAGFTSNEANPLVSPIVTTTCTVEVSDGYSFITGNVTVVVNPLPVVYAGEDQTIANGTSTTIGDASATGSEPLTFSWSPSGLLIDPAVLNPTTINLNANTVFTLTVTDGKGCQESDAVTIFIEGGALAVNPAAYPESICIGSTSQLSANPSGGSWSYSYNWTSVPAGFTSTEANPVVSPAETTTYTVEVNDGYAIITGNVTVNVYPVPQVSCPDDFSICENTPSFILSGSEPAGGTYSGTGVSGGIFDPSAAGVGTWEITYIYSSENGCDDTCGFNITITAPPVVLQTVVTNETDSQQNGAIEIIATGTTPQLFYSVNNGINWQTNNGLFENLSAGLYTCIVRDENNCDTSFTVEITNTILTRLQAITGSGGHCLGDAVIVPLKVDEFISVGSFQLKLSYNADNLLCEGYANAHPLLADHLSGWVDQAAGEITLQWQDAVPLTLDGLQIVAELVFTPKQPGQGQLDWYTGSAESYFVDISGLPIPAEFHSEQISIYDPPVIILSAAKSACIGEKLTITSVASSTYPPLRYQWTYPDGHTSETDPFIMNVTYADAGDYTLLATDSMGCTDQKTIRLVVSENPVAAFNGTDTLEVPPGYILDAGSGLAYYLWNTGETTESITITTEGMYTVEMESGMGCIGKDSVFVKLTDEVPPGCLFIPNAFTPDNDGLNDTFKPVVTCPVTFYRMFIYNRWGEKLFETDNISEGWDGKKNGVPCPGDVYVYKIAYNVVGAEGDQLEKLETGAVTIVK